MKGPHTQACVIASSYTVLQTRKVPAQHLLSAGAAGTSCTSSLRIAFCCSSRVAGTISGSCLWLQVALQPAPGGQRPGPAAQGPQLHHPCSRLHRYKDAVAPQMARGAPDPPPAPVLHSPPPREPPSGPPATRCAEAGRRHNMCDCAASTLPANSSTLTTLLSRWWVLPLCTSLLPQSACMRGAGQPGGGANSAR